MATERELDALAGMLSGIDGRVDRLEHGLPDSLRAAFKGAIEDALKDDALTKRFWEVGYSQLQEHAVKNSSQWVGRKLITAVVTAMVTAGIIWLVKSGAIKP